MVKGTSKRIVVVKSPDPKVFEEAIFIVKEDFLGRQGRTSALKEAQKVADAYIRSAVSAPRSRFRRIPPLAWAAVGAALSALAVIALQMGILRATQLIFFSPSGAKRMSVMLLMAKPSLSVFTK